MPSPSWEKGFGEIVILDVPEFAVVKMVFVLPGVVLIVFAGVHKFLEE